MIRSSKSTCCESGVAGGTLTSGIADELNDLWNNVSIIVESELGKGTTSSVFLPLVEPAASPADHEAIHRLPGA